MYGGDNLGDGMSSYPTALRTSQPGVFAVGDVPSGSMERVAAAVGEGTSAIRSVHQVLGSVAVWHSPQRRPRRPAPQPGPLNRAAGTGSVDFDDNHRGHNYGAC